MGEKEKPNSRAKRLCSLKELRATRSSIEWNHRKNSIKTKRVPVPSSSSSSRTISQSESSNVFEDVIKKTSNDDNNPNNNLTNEKIDSEISNFEPCSIGFVPTMGALHEGHLSLIKRAKEENDIVFVSIFINPTQFGPEDDFDQYPRKIDEDVDLISQVGCDYVFLPSKEDMYTPNHRVDVLPQGFEGLSEGKARPGHFRGVATIVSKLFNLILPTRAYFGQKDAMQCVVVRRLIEDLNFNIQLVVCPTVREKDGLAMSSRNNYLKGEKERQAATVVYKALTAIKKSFLSHGFITCEESSAQTVQDDQINEDEGTFPSKKSKTSTLPIESRVLRKIGLEILNKEPLVSHVEYISFGSKETMEELEFITEEGAIVSTAIKLGTVRLIDNMFL